ncbi:unnamed protein product [Toxocara canis]|uniref:Glycosyltransferase family 92 protein n=1 Tax=Toxocara canis TaxID=6265 RepID=A0A183TWI1_TOXCA|nr:unnamed protein product [Toxocara canis]
MHLYGSSLKRSLFALRRSFALPELSTLAIVLYRVCVIICALLTGAALYYRTTNVWTLKNLSDSFLIKHIGRRPIIIGAFHRMQREQNVPGYYVIMQFVGDSRQVHSLYCFSSDSEGNILSDRAHIERIHKGKRAANDICSWSGHVAECRVASALPQTIRVSTKDDLQQSIEVPIEAPLNERAHDLVVCMAPMYTYIDWQIMLLGIENWLSLGATKIIIPVQSASSNTLRILDEYAKDGIVIVRQWPKWPVLSDTNPNGLILSRGLEESHVNCLFFVKPWANMVAFTDMDDMLIPPNPMDIHPKRNIEILQELMNEHPQAGSFLFEHRDVQLVLPKEQDVTTIRSFNFNFLENTKWKSSCKVWRMKTRVIANASRVDSVNMHETGILRFGYVQVRVPCHKAHFYHLRHSYTEVERDEPLDMSNLIDSLNRAFSERLTSTLVALSNVTLNKSSTESFADFDRCTVAISDEHWKIKVSRDIDCMASEGGYEFAYADGDFVIVLTKAKLVDSDPNCEAPLPKILKGNHFYLP